MTEPYREPTLQETGETTAEQIAYLEAKYGKFPSGLRQELEKLPPWIPDGGYEKITLKPEGSVTKDAD